MGKSGHGFGRATLDGDHRGSVLTIQSHSTVTIRGLLITHGTAPSGGGIHVRGSMSVAGRHRRRPQLRHRLGFGGGGIGIDSGTLTLVDSTVRDNTAQTGGGIRIGGGTVDIVDSIVRNNTASYGGGIFN